MYRTQRGVFSHQLDDISGSIELPLLRLRGDTELPEEILINPPDFAAIQNFRRKYS